MLGIASPDLEEVAVLTGHVVHFEHLGHSREALAGVFFLLGGSRHTHRDEGQLT